MLSQIAWLMPVPDEENLKPTPDVPSVWETNKLDPYEKIKWQSEQFHDFWLEAKQKSHETRYVLLQDLLGWVIPTPLITPARTLCRH